MSEGSVSIPRRVEDAAEARLCIFSLRRSLSLAAFSYFTLYSSTGFPVFPRFPVLPALPVWHLSLPCRSLIWLTNNSTPSVFSPFIFSSSTRLLDTAVSRSTTDLSSFILIARYLGDGSWCVISWFQCVVHFSVCC